jgi:hypothetical protein
MLSGVRPRHREREERRSAPSRMTETHKRCCQVILARIAGMCESFDDNDAIYAKRL